MSKPCRQTCPLPPPRAVIAEECFGQWNGPTGLEITEEMLLPALLAGSLVSNYFTLRSRVFPARVVIKMTQCNNITKCKVLDKYFRSSHHKSFIVITFSVAMEQDDELFLMKYFV